MKPWVAVCLLAGAALPALAAGSGDAMQWLQRVVSAPQRLSYTGVFMYRNGNQTETSRITHLVDNGNELERLETLDGSQREVFRRNDEVRCILSESRLMIVEQGGARRFFPALIPASLGGLGESYDIRKGDVGRVAGLEAQSIVVEPKDKLRYGRRFWVDSQSGMLLKATLVDEAGKPLEVFAFTELRVGEGVVDRNSLLAKPVGNDWRVRNVHNSEGRVDAGQWSFNYELPGFRRVSSVRRQTGLEASDGLHLVFSDGLAAISVFIEPASGKERPEAGELSMGAINVYRRWLPNYKLVLMGDVPPAALKLFGDGIERR